MIQFSYGRLRLNPHVIISRLRSGKEYILLKINGNYFPYFIKDDCINILHQINNISFDLNKLNENFSAKEMEYLYNLIEKKIVLKDTEDDKIELNINYQKELDKLNYLALKTRTPLQAKFELTYNCNYKCKYCYIDGSISNVCKFNEIKKILEELKFNGVNELFLTGGEPFLHPNILEVIEHACKLGLIVTVQTNGSHINKSIAEKICGYTHLRIALSFHSCYEEIFDEFTKINGSFRKTLDAIENLKKYNINLLVKYTVTTETENHLKEVINYLKDLGVNFQVYTQVLPNINDNEDNSKYTISKESIQWLYENSYLKFNKSYCSALKTKLWISPLGDVYPCELVRENLGNIVQQTFNEIWEGETAQQLLASDLYKLPEICKKCDKEIYCNRCLAYFKYDGWNSGIAQFCKIANVVQTLHI